MLARAFLLATFVLAGVHKATHFGETVRGFAEKAPRVPFPAAVIAAAAAVELLAPAAAMSEPVLGRRFYQARRASALALMVFTVAATALYHPPRAGGYMSNLKLVSNAGLFGGLALLYGLPPQ